MTDFLEFLNPDAWPTFVVVTSRVVGVMFVAPVWSMPSLPRNVRLALGMVLGMAMAGLVDPIAPGLEGLLFVTVVTELFLGLLIGLAVATFLYGVQVASEVTSVQMGLAMAASFAPGSGIGGPGIGTIQNLFVIGIYLTLGGHLMLTMGLAESFVLVPPGMAVSLLGLHGEFLAFASGIFVTAVKVAAPIMAAMMLSNVLLGILSKAVPQINTLMVAFPITITLGFIVLLGSLPFLLAHTRDWIDQIGPSVMRVLNATQRF